MWNKEVVESLILQYQQHENLYDVKNPSYLDRVKRSNALFSICQELKKYNANITPEDIKKKIHTLRAQYVKESREVTKSKRSGVGANDVYTPKLWCFPQLEFLKSHCTSRESTSNISEAFESNSSFEIDSESDDLNNTEDRVKPSCSKRKKTFNLEERMNNVKKLILDKAAEKSCYDWLGKQVVFEISRLKNERIQRDAVWSIQQILRKSSVEDAQAEAQPSCSFFTPPPESSFTPLHPCRTSSSASSEFCPSPECNSQSSSILSTNTDILQQSLTGVLDDEDF